MAATSLARAARPGPAAREGAAAPALGGPEKAGLLLLSMPEERAAEILKHLDPRDIRRIHDAVEAFGRVPPDALEGVYREMADAIEDGTLALRGGADYLRRAVTRALGAEHAAHILDDPPPPPREEPLDRLGRVEAPALGGALAEEHPQSVAALLAHLPSDRSAEILDAMPDARRRDVLRRMAALQSVPVETLIEAERALAAVIGEGALEKAAPVDGAARAAAILNQLDPDIQTAAIEALAADDPDAANDIRRAMFTFEDLEGVDRRGMQVLLREIANEQLMLALKTASEELRAHILGAMSRRAGEMLMRDLEALGPQRLSDVEKAQREIVEVALRLSAEGKVVIAGRGNEELV